jgi:hypothetical protein
MKTLVRLTAIVMAVAIVCGAGIAWAETYSWVSAETQPTAAPGTSSGTANQQGTNTPAATSTPACGQCGGCAEKPCESCGNPACGGCSNNNCGGCGCIDGCEDCPSWGILGFAGLESFKGRSDGSFESNFGEVTGLNIGVPVLKDYGLGWQIGLSYGVYDWDGWGDPTNPGLNRTDSQTQLFVTTGFFHKAKADQKLSYGLVYDWSVNENWGEFIGSHPTMGQWRGQVEYSVNNCNGIGIWGTLRDRSATQVFDGTLPVTNRAISQVNFFWHHKFSTGAASWLYLGFPENERLEGQFGNGGGSLGTWMLGANFEAPLSDRLALYANGSYFRPSVSAGSLAAMESGYDIGVGVVWYFGRNAISHSLNGKCSMPYMPVANNSTFLVDQSEAY